MCCVMPPNSCETTSVRRIESSSNVFPWSTCPMIVTTGARGSSRLSSTSSSGSSSSSIPTISTSYPSSVAERGERLVGQRLGRRRHLAERDQHLDDLGGRPVRPVRDVLRRRPSDQPQHRSSRLADLDRDRFRRDGRGRSGCGDVGVRLGSTTGWALRLNGRGLIRSKLRRRGRSRHPLSPCAASEAVPRPPPSSSPRERPCLPRHAGAGRPGRGRTTRRSARRSPISFSAASSSLLATPSSFASS